MESSDSIISGASEGLSKGLPVPAIQEAISRASAGLVLVNHLLLGEDYTHGHTDRVPIYSSTVQGVTMMNAVIGSFGLQVWDPSEPVLCHVLGTPSEKTFFTLAKGKFRKQEGGRLTILKADKQAIRKFELNIDGIRFALQYFQADFVSNNPISNPLVVPIDSSTFSMVARQRIAYGNAVGMRRNIRDLNLFQAFYRCIKNWAVSNGVYSSRFSYLSEPLLLPMVFAAYQRTSTTSLDMACYLFFHLWMRIDPELAFAGATGHGATPQGCPVLAELNENGPLIKFSDYTTKQTLKIIVDQMKRTLKDIWSDPIIPKNVFFGVKDFIEDSGVYRFWTSHSSYIKIDVSYWGPSRNRCGRSLDLVESEILEAVKRLNNTLGQQITPRVWPQRMIYTKLESEVSYLIGLDLNQRMSESFFKNFVHEKLLVHLEKNITSSPLFDDKTIFLAVELMRQLPDCTHFIPDDKDWSLVPAEPSRDDSGDEEEEPFTFDTPQQQRPSKKTKLPFRNPPPARNAATSSNLPQTPIASTSVHPSPPPSPPPAPLRPALDVLHRIRHDPAIDEDDYLVGYLDRHSGMLTMPVSLWRAGDTTTEEFIPQSRIWFFERKSDRVRVWDRERKVDRVFGSGRKVGKGM